MSTRCSITTLGIIRQEENYQTLYARTKTLSKSREKIQTANYELFIIWWASWNRISLNGEVQLLEYSLQEEKISTKFSSITLV